MDISSQIFPAADKCQCVFAEPTNFLIQTNLHHVFKTLEAECFFFKQDAFRGKKLRTFQSRVLAKDKGNIN